MSFYRDPVQGDARLTPQRLDALLTFIRHNHPFITFAGVEIYAETIAGGVSLTAQRQGQSEQQRWFSADTRIDEISAWCKSLEDKFRARQEPVGRI